MMQIVEPPAQDPCHSAGHPVPENARVARLAGLAEVWGAVKYFHPFLAYRKIEWDQALVETIPKLNAATTPQESQAALNHMLNVLRDRNTRADIQSDAGLAPSDPMPPTATDLMRTEQGVLVIDAIRIARIGAQDIDTFDGILSRLSMAIRSTNGVVIDGRAIGQTDDRTADCFSWLLQQLLPQVLDTNVTLGSTRYRMHNGYAPQRGLQADGYYSAFVTVVPRTLHGQNKRTSPPLVLVINEHTPPMSDILSGLQSAHRAFIVQEGEPIPEMSQGTFTLAIPDGIRVRIGTYEWTNVDGSVGFQADAVVPRTAGEDAAMQVALQAVKDHTIRPPRPCTTSSVIPQIGHHDIPYADMECPPTEYRLLALFRFWNIVQYFYPYKDLLDASWTEILPRYIRKFEANTDAVDYQLTVREMVTELHDSHGWIQNATASDDRLGAFMPPLLVRYVEQQTVVTSVLDDTLSIGIGDVILTVDGEAIAQRGEWLSRFIASSTPQALMERVHKWILGSPKGSRAQLRVRDVSGHTRDVDIARSLSLTDPRLVAGRKRTSPAVQVLPDGYGYVDLDRLQVAEVEDMFAKINPTPAVIFDLRGYPHGTAWSIAPRLTEKATPVGALFSRPLLEAKALGNPDLSNGAQYTFAQRLPERTGEVYKGKVVVLINEETISQAEHTCLFFEAATDVTFIGTPTVGANGDITCMVLPGNLTVVFTGQNVRHADGRQLQRLGIQPTIRVVPTIAGIRAGRDEILARAVQYLNENM